MDVLGHNDDGLNKLVSARRSSFTVINRRRPSLARVWLYVSIITLAVIEICNINNGCVNVCVPLVVCGHTLCNKNLYHLNVFNRNCLQMTAIVLELVFC